MDSSSSSTSGNWRYDVFPSFRGEYVRKSFLSHLLRELERKLIITFIDHGIERSQQIGPELLSAIKESRIAIVIFSKNYASSTWCLNELVEIHKCYKELDQVVIPIFYGVDPSHVRWQEGEFSERFEKTCMDKTDDERQRWIRALTDVANLAGEDSKNWSDEANMIEHIAKDVFNKLMTPSNDSNDFGDFVGIKAHLERLNKLLCLEYEEVRILGIVGPSGIGKSTIGRALYSQLSSRFYHHAFFISYKRTIQEDDYSMKLRWEEQLLSEISREKDINISHLGVVKKMLMHTKVLIIVDDVDDFELVKTLVEQTRCVGSGSRILVITQDRKLLKSHKIDLIYEVEFPMEDLALKIFCRSAFGQNSPPYGFMELTFEVAELSGNLPLGLSVLGSSLRGMDKEEWVEMLPRLRNSLDGKIEKTLRVSYDGLDGKDQELFLYIACLFRGHGVNRVKDLLGDSANIGLKILADKSLIRIVPLDKTVQMHSLLRKLGKEIVRAESINNPGKRRFLMDAEEICDVLADNTGTENVEAIDLNMSNINKHLFIDENSFQGMHNLKFLIIFNYWSRKTREERLFFPPVTGEGRLFLPRGFVHFPRKIRLLHWDEYPSKCLPFNFKADYLVELELMESKLEKLWEGTQLLRSLKKMDMSWSEDFKEIPDLSKAINLETLNLRGCTSLVTLPPSIQNLNKLQVLDMRGCSKLKVLPAYNNLKSLDFLGLSDCKSLIMTSSVGNLKQLDTLNMNGCESLVEIPDLPKATNLGYLELQNCKSLVMLPSSIRNLNNLRSLCMEGCTLLEVLPTDVNLVNLLKLDLRGCSKLRNFPQISTRIVNLYLKGTAIEEIPSWIEKMYALHKLTMSRCKMLKIISPSILKLKYLVVDFPADGRIMTMLPQTSLQLNNCFNLDQDARELILQSYFFCTVLPGGEVPLYFTHRACGTSLIIPLSEISLSQENLGFKACIVVGPPTHPKDRLGDIGVRWCFRGKKGVIPSRNEVTSCIEDHLVMLFFVFPEKEVYESPSEWKNNVLQLEFYYHNHGCPCNNFGPDRNTKTCPLLSHRIKGCGVRFVNIPPSRFLYKLEASLEEKVYYQEFGESDISKKRMRMTVSTSEEPSNSQTAVNSELISPNLELSLGLVGASAVVSSRSNVPSLSRSFHGDDGPSLSLSLSSFDPCLGGETLYFGPMIIDQQDTGTPNEDPSLSPQLLDYFSGQT